MTYLETCAYICLCAGGGLCCRKTAALEVEINKFIPGLAMFQRYLRALGICDALNNLGKSRAELKRCGKIAVKETGLSE
jgi:hypothetical protein